MINPKTPPVVLVTRPQQDAVALEAKLRERGFSPLLSPMLKITYLEGARTSLDGVQALIFTSANGVRSFFSRNNAVSLPAYTVGEVTAATARAYGCVQTESAGGDVNQLANLLISRCDPEGGGLLHIAGSNLAGDLGKRLSSAGYKYKREVFYKAEKLRVLDKRCQEVLAGCKMDFALFFSPRTAVQFIDLALSAGFDREFERSVALCLSEAIAEKLNTLPWQQIITASAPTQCALLNALDKVSLQINNGV